MMLIGYTRDGGIRPSAPSMLCIARPICLRLFAHEIRLAASRAFWTAGRSIPIKIEMIAITTSNSISVKALRAVIKHLCGIERRLEVRRHQSVAAHTEQLERDGVDGDRQRLHPCVGEAKEHDSGVSAAELPAGVLRIGGQWVIARCRTRGTHVVVAVVQRSEERRVGKAWQS